MSRNMRNFNKKLTKSYDSGLACGDYRTGRNRGCCGNSNRYQGQKRSSK